MSKKVALLLVLVLTASSIITFLPVKAEGRTIVVPDDYPTIMASIANAIDGDTILVRKGTYKEHSLVINKTIIAHRRRSKQQQNKEHRHNTSLGPRFVSYLSSSLAYRYSNWCQQC